MSSRVCLVDLGRGRALGATRRVSSWTSLWTAAGAEVDVVPLLRDCRRSRLTAVPAGAVSLLRPDVVPETALWSAKLLRSALAEARPDVVVFLTARSWAPHVLPAGATAVLDYVDHLSANYAQRAGTAGLGRSFLLRGLSQQMRAFEGRSLPHLTRTAAGREDARALGAEWVPNFVAVPAPRATAPDVDLLFVGTLSYEPNIAAVQRLLDLWPRMLAVRPRTTLLVAGANPSPALVRRIREAGAELDADFADLGAVCARARVAVAPLAIGTGIQNKVLEAAAHGVAQVVDPHVLRGVAADFPVVTAVDDEALVREVARLLDEPEERAELARRAREAVEREYSASAWSAWGRRLVDKAGA